MLSTVTLGFRKAATNKMYYYDYYKQQKDVNTTWM